MHSGTEGERCNAHTVGIKHGTGAAGMAHPNLWHFSMHILPASGTDSISITYTCKTLVTPWLFMTRCTSHLQSRLQPPLRTAAQSTEECQSRL
jgi:hypothetical protein